MAPRSETRRDFLKHASLALALPLALGCKADSIAIAGDGNLLAEIRANANSNPKDEWWGARHAPPDVTWRTQLASPNDTGEKIIIRGTVYQPDGKTPAPNTLIYLYHTDVYGKYGQDGEPRHGRYRGWMLTDVNGRYEFESIMPASYPNSTIAKHIHMTVTTTDMKEDWVDSILFDGDRYLTIRDRTIVKGGFDPVMKMVKEKGGTLVGVRDIRLWV